MVPIGKMPGGPLGASIEAGMKLLNKSSLAISQLNCFHHRANNSDIPAGSSCCILPQLDHLRRAEKLFLRVSPTLSLVKDPKAATS